MCQGICYKQLFKVSILFTTIWSFIGVIQPAVISTKHHRQYIRLGLFAPITLPTGGDAINQIGCQYVSTFFMTVRELNQELKPFNITILATVRDGVGMSTNTFTTGVRSALDYANTAYQGKGVHGVVGGLLNYPTIALGYVLRESSIAQIAYGADAADLSHTDVFRYFMRTYPPAPYQAQAMVKAIAQYFGWKRVAVVYTTDTYGTDAVSELKEAVESLAEDQYINIVASIGLTVGQSVDTYSNAIEAAMKYQPRIFLLLVSNPTTAATFLQQSWELGLLTTNSVVFGTSEISQSTLWKNMPDQSLVSTIMTSIVYFGLLPADTDWVVTDRGSSFLKRYRNQTATVTTLTSGARVCNGSLGSALDDDGYYMYKIKTATKYTCTGFEFWRFTQSGTNIAGINAHVYDATRALVFGILNVTQQSDGTYVIPDKVDGLAVKKALIDAKPYQGLSGMISFSGGGRNGVQDYGCGDRIQGLRFQLVNLRGNCANHSLVSCSLKLSRVGTWTQEGGVELCSDNPLLQTSVTGGCYDIDYRNADNSVPSDRDAMILMKISSSGVQALNVLGAIQTFTTVVIAVLLVWHRKSKIMKISQYPMSWLIWSSSVFGVMRIWVASTDPGNNYMGDMVCQLRYWTGHLTFIAVIALFMKTLRVHLLVNTGHLFKRKTMATSQVLYATFALYAIVILYVAVTSALFPRHINAAYAESPLTGQIICNQSCHSDNHFVEYALFLFEAVILVLAAKVCYDTKDVPDAISESRTVAKCIAAIIIISVLAFTLDYTVLKNHSDDKEITVGVAFFLGCMSILGLYFGPKFYYLLSGADLNNKFKIVRKNSSKKTMAEANTATQRANTQPVEDKEFNMGDLAVEAKREALRSLLKPKNVADCEEMVNLLRGILVDMQVQALRDSTGSGDHKSGSGGGGGGGRGQDPSSAMPNRGAGDGASEVKSSVVIRHSMRSARVGVSGHVSPIPMRCSPQLGATSRKTAPLTTHSVSGKGESTKTAMVQAAGDDGEAITLADSRVRARDRIVQESPLCAHDHMGLPEVEKRLGEGAYMNLLA